jgi:hypothetical protein
MKKQCYIKFRFWEEIKPFDSYKAIEEILLFLYEIEELSFLFFSETKVNRNQYRIVNNSNESIVIELQTRIEESIIDELNEYYIEYDDYDIEIEASSYYNLLRVN